MTPPHRVSVIIPARNADKYIAETFDSLLAQTDPSWQAIVINDKSTDGTQAIIDAYAARDPRFVSFQGPGVGVSSARNLGLDKAQVERIMFLDSDDWIAPNWLELMNRALDSDPDAVVAYCGYKRVMVDGHTHDMEIRHGLQTDPFGVMARVCAVGIHTVLIDRRELEIVGRFDTAMPNCEDWDLWLRIARRPGKWVEVPQYLSYYRCGHSSLSQNVDSVMAQSEVVLNRGFSRDPRVPDPAPQNRHGTMQLYRGEFKGRIAGLSAWCMGSSAGSGRNVEATRKLLRPIENSERSLDWLPHTIIEGFVQGSGIAGDALVAHWEVVEPQIETVLTVLGEQWQDDEAISMLREGLQLQVLSLAEPSEPKRVGKYIFVNVDLRAPETASAFDGLDRLFARLTDGDEKIGEVVVGIVDEIPAEDWMPIALNALDHQELRERFGASFADTARRLRHEAPGGDEAGEGAVVDAARTPLRGEAKVVRNEADDEHRSFVPVLMYHAVADEGPPALGRYRLTPRQFEAQMLWLRQHGYHSISSADLAHHLAHNKAFTGRPVLITFDDGMQNFADNAWPILKKYGFTPEMFIVTDKLGGTSDWDAGYGSNYRLMDAATIQRLAQEGVIFGSHMATHPKADKLSTRALLDELERSRDKLTELLGKPPIALAAPYGMLDVRYAEMARRAGYAICYGSEYRAASLDDLPLQVPRLEVFGNWQLKDFARAMKPMLLPDFQMIESDELLSVVVPAHDDAETIEAAINSIRDQSHRNLEIIVVDDGSGDATLETAEALAALDDRIRVVSQKRSGTAAARNAGWQAARGKAVAFIDADDTVAPEMIRALYSALVDRGDGFGLAYCWSNRIDSDGKIITANPAHYNYGEVLEELLEENFVANGSAALIWRHVLTETGGFDSGLRLKGAEGSEDLQFYLRVAEKYKFAQVPDYLTNDRRPPRSRTGFASRAMRSWYLATDEVLARHPQLAEAAKAGARKLAKRLATEALYAQRPLELPKLLGEVAPRDPMLAVRLPLSLGRLIARKLRRRIQRLGVVGTLRSIWSQMEKRT